MVDRCASGFDGVPDIELCERRERRERRRHRSGLLVPESAITAGARCAQIKACNTCATEKIHLPFRLKILIRAALNASLLGPFTYGTAHLTSSVGHRLKATCVTRPPAHPPKNQPSYMTGNRITEEPAEISGRQKKSSMDMCSYSVVHTVIASQE